MNTERVYSTAEICQMFGISKSTLFRWEREGQLPPVARDLNDQRQYSQEHVRAISQKQKERLSRMLRKAYEREDTASAQEIAEEVSIKKFMEGDLTGLSELREYPRLSGENMRQLLAVALERYSPGEKTFCDILEVVWEQSCKLTGQFGAGGLNDR